MGRILDILQGEELSKIRIEIESFCDNLMGEYLVECKETCENKILSSLNTKNFYDSVWGTIEIYEGEIFVLDSPILQRLRYIKQLGLADLLYSSADHSRFSHTLGVIRTADVKKLFRYQTVFVRNYFSMHSSVSGSEEIALYS